jgi:hypothetical protein
MNTKDPWIAWCAFVVLVLAVGFLAYGPHRSDSALLIGGYAIAFVAYVLFSTRHVGLDPRRFFTLAIAVRVLLLFAPITWTDDHYRYWWDGLCTVNDLSPFAHTPRELLTLWPDIFSSEHLAMLNSPDFHSAYPPLAQAAFALSAWFGGAHAETWMVGMRIIVLLCEIASLWLLVQLLRGSAKGLNAAALYAFNPLVLMELTVNLHTEALMIPLCFGAVLMARRDRWWVVGLLIGLAASIRLMPMVFLLAFPAVVGWRRSVVPSLIAMVVLALSWLPFWTPDLVPNFLSSLKLFSTYLEFNGGLFELLRRVMGDGAVKGTGLLGVATVIALFTYALVRLRKGALLLEEAMLWLLALVLFGSQAVHPWYITPLIAFAALTHWRWPLWWSLLIVPTYLTYGSLPFAQPYWWVAVEYVLLALLIAFEWYTRRSLWPGPVNGRTIPDLRRS